VGIKDTDYTYEPGELHLCEEIATKQFHPANPFPVALYPNCSIALSKNNKVFLP